MLSKKYECMRAKELTHLGGGVEFFHELSQMAAKVVLLRQLSEDDLRIFSAYANTYRIGKAEILFEEGEDSGCLFFIVEGAIDVYKLVEKHKQRKITSVPAGFSLGEMSIIDGMPYSATAMTAAEDTTLIVMTKKGFTELKEQHPTVIVHLLEGISMLINDRLRQSTGIMAGALAKEDMLVRKKEKLQVAKQQAEDANQAKSAFLADMSHEIRTPLNAVLGYTEMLQEDAADLELDQFVGDLGKIHASGKHLLSLINNILDLSKIEAGRMTLYEETFELIPFIEETMHTVAPLLSKNNNTMKIRFDDFVHFIRTDKTKLRQIILNLFSNACKFTKDGQITLSITREIDKADSYLFQVRDTGIGMTPEQLGKLFKAFSQAEAATSSKYGGTGLGLAVSKALSKLMGGDISVQSAYGEGTAFTLILPANVKSTDLPVCT
ncbi:MAG: cyclic nucleotide-binding domain-containing protein [Gammaproteobacteria bacterium]|nr:cyclic nucleotide-binding domain-containing protein [Gammaproteobacteria bacterium]